MKKRIGYFEKIYKIYVYNCGVFEFMEEAQSMSRVDKFVSDDAFKFKFIRVENFTNYLSGKYEGECRLVKTSIFLGGQLVLRKRDILPQDMDILLKSMTKVYGMDGVTRYYPNLPLSCQDVRKMIGVPEDKWFTIVKVNEFPSLSKKEDQEEREERWSVVSFDWGQTRYDKSRKVKNELASFKLGMDLYGDILYINENLIA